jgi:hypothetical protein
LLSPWELAGQNAESVNFSELNLVPIAVKAVIFPSQAQNNTPNAG